MKIKAIKNRVLVEKIEKGERKTAGGIVLPDDNGKDHGIRARWGKVFSVGPDVKADVKVGEWICVEHGRWTRPLEIHDEETNELKVLWGIEEESILLVSDEQPVEFASRY